MDAGRHAQHNSTPLGAEIPLSAVTLIRIYPERNMRPYYRLDVQLKLFGAWSFRRERGRIVRAGRTLT